MRTASGPYNGEATQRDINDLRATLATILDQLALAYMSQGRDPDGHRAISETIEIDTRLHDKYREAPIITADLAKLYGHLALYDTLYEPDKEEEIRVTEINLLTEASFKAPWLYMIPLASAQIRLAEYYQDEHRRDDAVRELHYAIKLLEDETSRQARRELVTAWVDLGKAYYAGKDQRSTEAFYNALKIARELAGENPSLFEADLAETLWTVGRYLVEFGRIEEARTKLSEALEIYRRLKETDSSYSDSIASNR